MGRWEPDAQGRLRIAALDLFSERGFERTTVAEIAERAGLTERTFFRHFADKREVLFLGTDQLQVDFVRAIAGMPAEMAPVDAVGVALDVIAESFEDRRAYAAKRQGVIEANPALLERERIKLATLARAVAAEFRERGVAEPAASLLAESGVTVFRVGFERWTADASGPSLRDHLREALADLRAVTAG